jgi:LysR family transcriptional activator of nhaA
MTWLNYHHLYYFWSIAKEKSIANASRKLNVTQSSLSSQLKQLEKSMQVQLFNRIKKRLELTDAGKHVFKVANEIFELGNMLVSEIENNHLGVDFGTIRVGAVSTLSKNVLQFFLSPLIDSGRHRLEVISESHDNLMDTIDDFGLDLLISNRIPKDLNQGMSAHLIHSFSYCLVSKEKVSGRVPILNLIAENGIYIPKTNSVNKNSIDLFLKDMKVPAGAIKAEIEDTALLRLMATEGKGVVMIPQIGVYRDLNNRHLHVLQEVDSIQEDYYLIARDQTFNLLNLDVLISLFKKKLIKEKI